MWEKPKNYGKYINYLVWSGGGVDFISKAEKGVHFMFNKHKIEILSMSKGNNSNQNFSLAPGLCLLNYKTIQINPSY